METNKSKCIQHESLDKWARYSLLYKTWTSIGLVSRENCSADDLGSSTLYKDVRFVGENYTMYLKWEKNYRLTNPFYLKYQQSATP